MQANCIAYFTSEGGKIYTLMFTGVGYVLSEGWANNAPYKPVLESRILDEMMKGINYRRLKQIDTFGNVLTPRKRK